VATTTAIMRRTFYWESGFSFAPFCGISRFFGSVSPSAPPGSFVCLLSALASYLRFATHSTANLTHATPPPSRSTQSAAFGCVQAQKCL